MNHSPELVSQKFKEKTIYATLFGTLGMLSWGNVSAQTQWIGNNSSNFLDAGNWNNGAPSASTGTFINLTGPGKFQPVINGGSLNLDLLLVGISPLSPGFLTIQGGANVIYRDLDLGNIDTLTPAQSDPIYTQTEPGESLLVVKGPGTVLSSKGNSNNTNIGYYYAARVRVLDQAKFMLTGSTASIALGDAVGGAGYLDVDGSGSTVDLNAKLLKVGVLGTGGVKVTNQGTVQNISNLYLGQNAGGAGTVEILSGSSMAVNANAFVAATNNTKGDLTVGGTGSKLTVAGSIQIGTGGQGTVSVLDRATLTSGDVFVGQQSLAASVYTPGTGTFHVGNQSVANVTDIRAGIGTGTKSTLLFDGGSSTTVNDEFFTGYSTKAQSTVSVSGTDTSLKVARSIILSSPEADGISKNQMTVKDGATLNFAGSPSLSSFFLVGVIDNSRVGLDGIGPTTGPKEFSVLEVDNATVLLNSLNLTNVTLAVGTNSRGKVDVRNGGTFNVVQGNLYIGGASNAQNNIGEGEFNVRDPNSSLILNANGNLIIGSGYAATKGTLNVSNQALARITGEVLVGNYNNAQGYINLDHGQLNVNKLTIGALANSSGTVTLKNQSELTTPQALNIGTNSSKGTLVVQSGSIVNTPQIGVALTNTANTQGVLEVSGSNTLLSTPQLSIGGRLEGALIVKDSATVASPNIVLGVNTITAGKSLAYLYGNGTLEATSLAIAENNATTQSTVYIGQTEAGVAATAGQLNVSNITFGNNTATLNLAYTDTQWTLSSLLSSKASSSTGMIQHNTSGITYLTSNSTGFKGQTNITSGVLSLGNGGTSGNLSGTVQVGATLALQRSDNFTVDAVLSGAGSLQHKGSGQTTLTGNNSGFTGSGVVQAGTLVAGNVNALGGTTASYTTNVGGTLDVGANSITLAAVSNNGTLKVGVDKALTVGSYTQSNTGSLQVIAGTSGASLVSTGSMTLNGGLQLAGFGNTITTTPVKASDIPTTDYLVAELTGGGTIGGTFATSHVLPANALVVPEYLVKGTASVDSTQTKVFVKELALAWTDGTLTTAIGNFDMASGTSFHVDVGLSDRTGSFTSGWDGKTLTKSGAGTLVVSADNGYTGNTYVEQGILSVASSKNLGTGDLYLGNKNASGAAQLVFASSTGGSAVTTTGLNAGNSASITQDVFLGERLDNTISVTNAAHSVTLLGNVSNAPAGRALSNTSGLVKTGAGTLIIDPDTGNSVNYNGKIDVQDGTLQFGGDGSQITVNGDMQVSQTGAQLVFDIASNSMRVDGTVSTVTGGNPVVKSNNGTLLLTGSSQTSWDVTGGTLAVTDSMFNSAVALASGSTLAFVHDPLATPLTEATYSGLLTGVVGSQLQMNRSNSVLNLQYNSGSTIGDVGVLAGTLSFEQSDQQPAPSTNTVNRFEIAGGLTVANGAIAAISGTNTYLKIGGMANFQTGSKFKVALDSLRPTTADVLANGVGIDPNAQLEMSGFAVPVGYDPVLDPTFSQVFKASDLPNFSYFAIDSESTILNEFSNATDGMILNTPSYIIGKIHYRADTNTNAGGAAHSEIAFDDFHLAWLDNTRDASGNLLYANGDFHMDAGTALNIDVALTERSAEGGFAANWDGSSLLKDGDGLLILSNSNNSYTGNTTINGGALLTGADDVFRNSAQVVVGTDGSLELSNSTQHLQGLDVQGHVRGGNQQHDGGTNSTIVLDSGSVTVGGNGASMDIDHLVLNNDSRLLVNTGGSSITQITGSDESRVDVKGGGNWVVTDHSKVGNVTLDAGGTVDFGDPNHQQGTPGRTLEVQNWNSNGGDLKLYGRVGSDDVLHKDQLLINGHGTGDTHLSFIDRGGVENRIKSGEEIVLVRPGPEGQIDDDAFTGNFISGTQQFALGRFTNGSFGFNIPGLNNDKGSTVPMYGHYDALVGSLVRGSTAAVQSLGGLANLTTLDHCDTPQAFGRIRGASGDSTRGSSTGKTSYDHVNLLTGSSLYTDDLGVGCLNLGVFAGYGDVKNDYYFANNFQGKHTIRSQQLGAYARYDAHENWYLMASVLHGWDRATINDISDIERRTDATTMALGMEGGVMIPLADDLKLTPSAQWIYQRTSIDGVETALYPTEFESVGTNFVRLGSQLSYDYSEATQFNVQTHLWHQFDTETIIKPYANGVVLNPLIHQRSNTWGELLLGVNSQIDPSFSIFGSAGIEGTGNSNNQGFILRVGGVYRW